MSLTTFEFVELDSQSIEDAPDTGMISKHHTANFMGRGYIWTLLCEGDLDRSWSPGDEIC